MTEAAATPHALPDSPEAIAPERDLFSIRHNQKYAELTARLWDEMAPANEEGEN